jgi:chemotaxis protein CheC
VGFPESELVNLPEIADIIGGEEAQVAGIYVGVTGGILGGVLISIPVEQLPSIHSYLHGRRGNIDDIEGTIDMSAIAEFGNLLSASFINAIGDETEILIQTEPPEISVDMCLSVLDSVVARFNTTGDHTLLTKAVVLFGEGEQVGCNLMLFLEPESLDRLLTSFAAVVA